MCRPRENINGKKIRKFESFEIFRHDTRKKSEMSKVEPPPLYSPLPAALQSALPAALFSPCFRVDADSRFSVARSWKFHQILHPKDFELIEAILQRASQGLPKEERLDLIRVLNAYEAELEFRGIPSREETHIYSFLNRMALDSSSDWGIKLERERKVLYFRPLYSHFVHRSETRTRTKKTANNSKTTIAAKFKEKDKKGKK